MIDDYDIFDTPRMFAAILERYDEENVMLKAKVLIVAMFRF